ncbi:MAG: DoxX family protein [Nitrosopumilales archaeon]|nr:MAG: DoxX family protein [Nitrosopumilales archaeon]
MAEAKIRESKLHDIAHFGIRSVVGVLFIVHSTGKFDPGFSNFFVNVGLPTELQIPIGILELLGGTLLVSGVLTRIASSLLAIEMLGVIFFIKKLKSFSGPGGVELDLIALAILLVLIVTGPGRVSISHIVKKIPRFLQ